MVQDYLLRLAIMLPLVCGMIVGGLWLAKRYNARPRVNAGRKAIHVSESMFIGAGARLAVVDFAGKRILVAVTKAGVVSLAEAEGFALPEVADAH